MSVARTVNVSLSVQLIHIKMYSTAIQKTLLKLEPQEMTYINELASMHQY